MLQYLWNRNHESQTKQLEIDIPKLRHLFHNILNMNITS